MKTEVLEPEILIRAAEWLEALPWPSEVSSILEVDAANDAYLHADDAIRVNNARRKLILDLRTRAGTAGVGSNGG